MRKFVVALVSAASMLLILGVASSSSAVTHSTISASTDISNRPDSGINGNWAYDTFTRKAQVTNQGAVSPSNCGGTSPCYFWTGTIFDTFGFFTTIQGDDSPGAGSQNGGAPLVMGDPATGTFNGVYHYAFYSDQQTTSATPPVSENDNETVPTGNSTTGAWVLQFFNQGSNFWDSNGNSNPSSVGTNGRWTYRLGFGKDKNCPQLSSQWVDASFNNWGSDPVDGNIVNPPAGSC